MGMNNRERHKRTARKRQRRNARSTPPSAGPGWQLRYGRWKLAQKEHVAEPAW